MIKLTALIIGFFCLLPIATATVESLDAEINSEQVVFVLDGIRLRTALTTLTRNQIALSLAVVPDVIFVAGSATSSGDEGSSGSSSSSARNTSEAPKPPVEEEKTWRSAAADFGESKIVWPLPTDQPEADDSAPAEPVASPTRVTDQVTATPQISDADLHAAAPTADLADCKLVSLTDLLWLILLVIILLICYNSYIKFQKTNPKKNANKKLN